MLGRDNSREDNDRPEFHENKRKTRHMYKYIISSTCRGHDPVTGWTDLCHTRTQRAENHREVYGLLVRLARTSFDIDLRWSQSRSKPHRHRRSRHRPLIIISHSQYFMKSVLGLLGQSFFVLFSRQCNDTQKLGKLFIKDFHLEIFDGGAT